MKSTKLIDKNVTKFITSLTMGEFRALAETCNPRNMADDTLALEGSATQRDDEGAHQRLLAVYILQSLVETTIDNKKSSSPCLTWQHWEESLTDQKTK